MRWILLVPEMAPLLPRLFQPRDEDGLRSSQQFGAGFQELQACAGANSHLLAPSVASSGGAFAGGVS